MKITIKLLLASLTTMLVANAHANGNWNGRYYPNSNWQPRYTNTNNYYYNNRNNWVPYAAAALVTGAVIANAYQTRYYAPVATVYSPPAYTPTPASYVQPVTNNYYIQQSAPTPTFSATASPVYGPTASLAYFCTSNGLYYPQTQQCSGAWQVVPNY